MAASAIKHELIRTTLPKAKELRRVVEPLITLAQTDSVADRRLAAARLRDKVAVSNSSSSLGPATASAQGGCTILKCGFRVGDSAPMASSNWSIVAAATRLPGNSLPIERRSAESKVRRAPACPGRSFWVPHRDR